MSRPSKRASRLFATVATLGYSLHRTRSRPRLRVFATFATSDADTDADAGTFSLHRAFATLATSDADTDADAGTFSLQSPHSGNRHTPRGLVSVFRAVKVQ